MHNSILSVHVSQQERFHLNKIYHEVSQFKNNCLEEHSSVLARFMSEKIKQDAPQLVSNIEKLRDANAPSAIVISGLPDMHDDHPHLHTGELMSLSYAFLLGEPFQYVQQNEGKLVARVSPRDGFENTQSGFSRGHFGWHTDDRIFLSEHRTRWIQLLGIHNPSQSQTLLAPIDLIVTQLSPVILAILMENRFEVKMPTSFGFKNNIWSQPICLLWVNEKEEYEVGVPTYHVRPVNPADACAQEALALLLSVIDRCQYHVTLMPDTLLIFNNDRVLHGRTPIAGDRMILRTYVRPDLIALRKATGSVNNVFDARFLM